MRIFKRKTVCKNCGMKIMLISNFGEVEWYHIKRCRIPNKYCLGMFNEHLLTKSIDYYSIAEPKECDKK